jgi:hypothetical protein
MARKGANAAGFDPEAGTDLSGYAVEAEVAATKVVREPDFLGSSLPHLGGGLQFVLRAQPILFRGTVRPATLSPELFR